MSWPGAACLASLAVVLAASGDARAERRDQRPEAGDDTLLVGEFLAREEAPLASYRARRIMRAENERFGVRAEMEVLTELRPDGTFAYEILREEGSRYIRNKVLRKVLRDEAELRRGGDNGRGSLTRANYDFAEDRSAGTGGERRVLITAKRKDILLVNGALVLSDEGDLLRIEGRLAKNPSFWTRRVHIVRRYARIGGIRVPVATESIADVRFAGRSRFEMVYLYDSVNGRSVTHPSPMRAVWRFQPLDSADGVPDGIFDHATAP